MTGATQKEPAPTGTGPSTPDNHRNAISDSDVSERDDLEAHTCADGYCYVCEQQLVGGGYRANPSYELGGAE